MVKVRVDKKWEHKYDQGIHLENPTKHEIENAKEDAWAKGFKTIWVHRTKKEKAVA